MNIAVVANHNTPVIKKEGTLHNTIFHLIQELLSEGHEVTLYAIEGSIVPCRMVALDQVKNHSKMFYDDKNEEDYVIQNMNYAIAYQSIEKGNFDIVHSFNQHYLSIALGNASSSNFVCTLSLSKTHRLERCLSFQHWNKSSFVCTSESLRNHFKDFLPYSEVIYNGVEIEEFSVKRKNVISWDGVIEENTGLESLIQLATDNAFKILLMGPIENIEYYEACIAPEIKKGSVKYIGDISNEMKGDIFNSCKIYVNAHKKEVFDYYTILKAISLGTPVITWDNGVMKELIQPENGKLCSLGNYSELNQAVGEQISTYQQNKNVQLRPAFSLEHTVKKYLNLYRSLV